MPSDFRAVIMAQLDDKSVAKEINDIGSKHKIVFNNISFDRTALSNAIQSALNGQNININLGNASFNTQNLASQAQQIGSVMGRQLTQQLNAELSHIDIRHSVQQIINMQNALKDMGLQDSNVAKITQDLLKMNVAIQSVKTRFNEKGGININVHGIDSLGNTVNVLKNVSQVTEQLADGTERSYWRVFDAGNVVTQNFAKQEQQLQRNTASVMQYGDKLAALNTKFIGDDSKTKLVNPQHINEFNSAIQSIYNNIARLESVSAEEAVALKANINSQINATNLLAQGFYNVELAERAEEQQLQRNTASVTKYLSQLESLESRYSATSAKPILNPTHLNQISGQFDLVLEKISLLETASSNEAVVVKANIDSEINSLALLIQSLQQTETAEKRNEQQLTKNEAAILKYKATIEDLAYKAFNPNATKPLRDEAHISQTESAFLQTIMSVEQLRNVDSQTFSEMEANIDSNIQSLKLLVSSLRDTEYAASQLRAKPVNVVKEDQIFLLQKFIAEVEKAGISFNSFKSLSSADVGGIEGLKTMLNNVSNSDQLKQYLNVLSNVKNEFQALKQTQIQYVSETEVQTTVNKMETWLLKNGKAAEQYGDSVRQLVNDLKQMQAQGGVLPTDLKRITNGFTEIKTAAAAAGLTGRTFFQQILGAAKSLGRYFGVSTLVYRTFGTIKNGIKDRVDLDTALVDLKKTTDGTEAQLNSFYYTANESAKKLGVTTKEIISASADWSRLGLHYVSPLV